LLFTMRQNSIVGYFAVTTTKPKPKHRKLKTIVNSNEWFCTIMPTSEVSCDFAFVTFSSCKQTGL
jgi:hypothetical protein